MNDLQRKTGSIVKGDVAGTASNEDILTNCEAQGGGRCIGLKFADAKWPALQVWSCDQV